jgi:uncharacterized protein YbjT (DUF2867 family)
LGTNSKIILVTGATGRQGGAVAARLLADGWQVRALVRDADAPAVAALVAAGASTVVGTVDDRASLAGALRGVYGVFSVQPADEHEVRRGIAVADAALAAGVDHLIYSSVGGAESQARYQQLAKWRIEEHIRATDLPATILRPAAYMEDLCSPYCGLQTGSLTLPYRAGLPVQLIAVDDIGVFAAVALSQPGRYIGRALDISGDALTPVQIAEALSRAAGFPIPCVPSTMTFRDEAVPLSIVREQIPAAAAAFDWAEVEYYSTDIPALRRIHPELMDFPTWLATVGASAVADVLTLPAEA